MCSWFDCVCMNVYICDQNARFVLLIINHYQSLHVMLVALGQKVLSTTSTMALMCSLVGKCVVTPINHNTA